MAGNRRLPSESLDVLPPQKITFDLKQPSTSLSLKSDGSMVAVAGRKLFKLIKLGAQKFEVHVDLRDLPPKQLNLNYSSNDVQWNPNEDQQLATAPTNGSVVLWDLQKMTKSKISHVYENVHERAVNKLSFHPREVSVLLSGSQDATMCCFDTRVKTGPVATYKGSESVRDVNYGFIPPYDNYFAATFEDGTSQIWDRRNSSSFLKQWPSHNGPVYCCAWHPKENWIMTGGRDKTIKVWDIQQVRVKELYTVHALFPVARVQWRIGHKTHVTSCSQFLDNVVAIWDIRRPFIPFASFSEHTDDVTDFLWLSDSVLLSCSKDGKLVQQLFNEAEKPIERATPTSLSFKHDGNLLHAVSDSIPQKKQSGSQQTPTSFYKPPVDPYQEQFLLHTSSLKEFDWGHSQMFGMSDFIQCASLYKLSGHPLYELCDHNYKVARDLNRQDVAQVWLIVKLLYCGSDPNCSQLGLLPTNSSAVQRSGVWKTSVSMRPEEAPGTSSSTQAATERELQAHAVDGPTGKAVESLADDDHSTDVMEAMNFFEYQHKPDTSVENFGPAPQDWVLPAEPFPLRHDVVQRPPSPDASSVTGISVPSAIEVTSTRKHVPNETSATVQLNRSKWEFNEVVASMLKFYAEKGDVQTSVSILIVLGELGKTLVSDSLTKQWFSTYIDLLMQKQLWNISSLVIKLCPLPEISEMNQQSTYYHITCGKCNKLIERKGWQCSRCEKIFSTCSVCNGTVKGLFVWCQVCGHGGHLKHIRDWHKTETRCPAGSLLGVQQDRSPWTHAVFPSLSETGGHYEECLHLLQAWYTSLMACLQVFSPQGNNLFPPAVKTSILPNLSIPGVPIGDNLHCSHFIAEKSSNAKVLLSALVEVAAVDLHLAATHALSKKLDDYLFQSMLMTSSPANKARLLSASAPHARSWLSVIPSVRLGLHLDPAEFQAAVKWWLGTTLDPLGQPQCHADMVAMWLSNTMTCKTFLQSSVVVLVRVEAGRGLSGVNSNSCPADVLVDGWERAKPLASDVTVTCALTLATASLDHLGNHGGDVVTRHNNLRSVFVDFCHCAHLGVRVESGSGITPDLSYIRPAEVLVFNWERAASMSEGAAAEVEALQEAQSK
eukprot:Em0016g524a